MASTSWPSASECEASMSKYKEEMRPRQMEIFNILTRFREAGIPIEDAFWQGVNTAQTKITNGEDYTECFHTAGHYPTLSQNGLYNPYQDGYDTIIRENRHGWDQRAGVHNAYYGTGYRMFRLDDVFYLVYVNGSDEINKVESDYWLHTHIRPAAGAGK